MRMPGPSAGTIVLRVAVLSAVLVLATWGAHEIRVALNLQIRPDNEQQVHRLIMLGAIAYIGLLALPFVPGAEIGLAMLAAFGPAIAPLIYACTVASMMLAFVVGRFLPIDVLRRILSTMRMRRAADLVARAAPLSGDARLKMLLQGQSARALRLAIRYRYVALALAVNTPGNSVIGGGGGIMLMAGLSGIFSPLATVATIALSVSPVPLAMVFFGLRF